MQLMYDAYRATGYVSYLYFLSLMVLGNFIMMNTFLVRHVVALPSIHVGASAMLPHAFCVYGVAWALGDLAGQLLGAPRH